MKIFALIFLALVSLVCLFMPAPARADVAAGAVSSHAVIFAWHRFGEDAYPSTNIRLEQFEAQIEHLQQGGFTVLPLPEIVEAIKAGRALPDRTVGLSIDDAYRSILTEALPRFARAGFPFTVFVSTDSVDEAHAGIMSWDELRHLVDTGLVTIGSHSADHASMATHDVAAIRENIETARTRIRDELGVEADYFAWPYGEYSLTARDIVAESGHVAAFGQHSGAVGPGMDMFTLPRFALNERFGDLERFRLIAASRPLPVSQLEPAGMVLGPATNPPFMAFTLGAGAEPVRQLACYGPRGEAVELTFTAARRVRLDFEQPFPQGRARVNCTLPGADGRWFWFSRQFVVRD